ncbi:hypothetical protein DFQ30_011500 [Apophysomyces sp. BC1015]|nr:hypothetical protein DFQ30_011500 [Apophysomyces sp. BC1015]
MLGGQSEHECTQLYLALIETMPHIMNHVRHPQNDAPDAAAPDYSAQLALFNAGVSASRRLSDADRIPALSLLGSMLDRLPDEEIAANFDALASAAARAQPMLVAELVPHLQALPEPMQAHYIDRLLSITEQHGVSNAIAPLILATSAVFETALASRATPTPETALANRLERLQFAAALATFASELGELPDEHRQRTLAWLMHQIDKAVDRFKFEQPADPSPFTDMLAAVASCLHRLPPQQQADVFDELTDRVYALTEPIRHPSTDHGHHSDARSDMQRETSLPALPIETLANALARDLHRLTEPVQVRAFAWLAQHLDKIDETAQYNVLSVLIRQDDRLAPDIAQQVRHVAEYLEA